MQNIALDLTNAGKNFQFSIKITSTLHIFKLWLFLNSIQLQMKSINTPKSNWPTSVDMQ